MAVDQDREPELRARARSSARAIAPWYAAWIAARACHSSCVSGRRSAGAPVVVTAQMKPRPSVLRGAGWLGTAPEETSSGWRFRSQTKRDRRAATHAGGPSGSPTRYSRST